MSKHKLTTRHKRFLDLLFDECEGDHKLAAKLAGFKTSGYKIAQTCAEEIIERTNKILAMYSPKAIITLNKAMCDEGASAPGANIRLTAAQTILDRLGISKKEKMDINVESQHGLFILPPKREKDVSE